MDTQDTGKNWIKDTRKELDTQDTYIDLDKGYGNRIGYTGYRYMIGYKWYKAFDTKYLILQPTIPKKQMNTNTRNDKAEIF